LKDNVIPPPMFALPWVIKDPTPGSRAFTHLETKADSKIVTLWTDDVDYGLVSTASYIDISITGFADIWGIVGRRLVRTIGGSADNAITVQANTDQPANQLLPLRPGASYVILEDGDPPPVTSGETGESGE
jgi:hypothetical protein